MVSMEVRALEWHRSIFFTLRCLRYGLRRCLLVILHTLCVYLQFQVHKNTGIVDENGCIQENVLFGNHGYPILECCQLHTEPWDIE